MKLTRRNTIILTMLLTPVGVAVALMLSTPYVPSIYDANRIKLGMTKTEVDAILGATSTIDNSLGGVTGIAYEWAVFDGTISVAFAKDGGVEKVAISWAPGYDNFWHRMRRLARV